MKARQSLSLRQRQRLALSPGLMTGLQILRMPTLDLIEAVEAEAVDNPYLMLDDLAPRGAALSGLAYDFAVQTVAEQQSLVARLTRQIGAMSLPEPVRAVAEYLAGEVSDSGFLETSLDALCESLSIPVSLAEQGLAALQSCEPAGVGARSLAECLRLQLEDRGVTPDLAARMVAHLDLFAEGDWRALRRELGLEREELERLAALIRTLNPEPVAQAPDTQSYLFPDLVLEDDGLGGYRVALSQGGLAQVRLNTALISAGAGAPVPFAADRLARAEAMIRALQFRGETLLRIGQHIVAHQSRFFAHGPDQLAPLQRQEVAAALGLHGSTVGRAVAAKALDVGGRLFPLAMFFSPALPSHRQGEAALASFVVQRRIAQMIAEEPAEAPLSDAAICAALSANGVDIARRTVAKYRGCMRIPSSYARRRHKAARPPR